MIDKTKQKLPKHIMMMVDKGNLVSAIKTFATEQNISMDEAKSIIDDYEEQVKAIRQQKQDSIANKQAKKQAKKEAKETKSQAKNQDKTQSDKQFASNHSEDTSTSRAGEVHEQKAGTTNPFDNLNAGLEQHLAEQGYKKPLVPYWWKRVAVIVLVVAVLVVLIVSLIQKVIS